MIENRISAFIILRLNKYRLNMIFIVERHVYKDKSTSV